MERFNVSVYEEHDWVDYSMQEDAVYCFACRHFGGASTLTGDRHGLRVFIDTGYTCWKNKKKISGIIKGAVDTVVLQ